MEMYGRTTLRNGPHPKSPAEWGLAGTVTGLQGSIEQMKFWSGELYPERPGVADCAYYMRTNFCAYGDKCRYNHPRDRTSVGGAVRIGGVEYPERVGEPACQYYLRTGTCKFGASCKFHHPRNGDGSARVQVNSYGYPLRPGEKECSYYLKTGQCKFGMTCKYHHPQASGTSVPVSAHPFYPTVQSPLVHSPDQYGDPSSIYKVSRSQMLPGSYLPGAYSPVLLPPGVVPISVYSMQGAVSPVMSPGAQPSVREGSPYGAKQLSSTAPAFTGPYPPLHTSGSPPNGRSIERVFPERPGQPECQFYAKTGDCKFGSSCKFHHPPEWMGSRSTCALGPLGLPLRPGMQPCNFYLQRGYCRFGRTCKFDHPVGAGNFSPSASSFTDMPAVPYMAGSTRGTHAPSLSYSEQRSDLISGPRLNHHLTRSHSTGNTAVGLMFPQAGAVSLADMHHSS